MFTSSPEQSYFDRQTTGVGYVNRVREVEPDRGDPFLACTIAAFNGPKGKVEYHYYDVKVVGTDAKHLIRRCEDAANNRKRKVLIRFVLGDDWVEPYIHTSGEKTGKPDFWRKARLLFVAWIDVDGKRVYTAERKEAPASADDSRSREAPEPSSDPQNPPELSADETNAPAKAASF